jgi:hypothetical protein
MTERFVYDVQVADPKLPRVATNCGMHLLCMFLQSRAVSKVAITARMVKQVSALAGLTVVNGTKFQRLRQFFLR